ncbi:Mammalian cell entry related domain protein [mine drainage metagenome]|uniref:Mammalian cell entry related domain protein n=1 Tax=mine drainage metagenome TaxID=410659 RepID=T1C2J7_9ZZZZ
MDIAMNPRRSYAAGTGLFILLGFAALAYLATQTTSLVNFDSGPSYDVTAEFTNIGGLKDRAPVKLAGVRIGTVKRITLDQRSMDARVTLAISDRYNQIPEDSYAKIMTSGLLGDQFISLSPGGSPKVLKSGSLIDNTQSALQLENLIGKFMTGSGGSKAGSSGNK